MSTSGSFNTSSVGNFYFTFSWKRTGYNSTANEHYIYYELIAHNTAGSYRTVHLKNLWINGEQKFYQSGASGANGKKYYDGDVVTSGNITVGSSNSAGDGYLVASFEAGVGSWPNANCSGEGSWNLDRIPRYANFTEHYVKSTGLKTISVRWNADHTIDWVQYSLNGGGWTDTAGLDYTISGLSPNTSYNIRTRIRRQDSQLWTESGYIYGTTKDIARITSAADINDEQKPSMTYTNPSGEYFNPYIEVIVNGIITDSIVKSAINSTSGTYTFELTQAEKNLLYQRSANYPSIVIRYGVETLYNNVGTYWNWADRTFTIINANPTFTDFVTEEINEKVLNLTGNANKHIRKYSTLKVTISSGNKMITKKGANPDKYRVIVGQQSKDIAYSESDTYQTIENMDANTVQVFAIDSRKKETPKEKSLDIINYKELILNNIEFNRKNGVEETVLITGNGTWTNVDFGEVVNSIKTFVFRCKKKTENTWSDWYSIKELFHINEDGKFNNKVENEFIAATFDFGEEYNIEVKLEDELSVATRNASVNSGKILMSALKEYGVAFGGIYDPAIGGSLQVNGEKIEKVLVVDNLNSTSTVDALSANQGNKLYDMLVKNSKTPVGEFTLWEGNIEKQENGSYYHIGTYYAAINGLLGRFPVKGSPFTRKYKIVVDYSTTNISNGHFHVKLSKSGTKLHEYLFTNIWGSTSDGVRTYTALDFDVSHLGDGHLDIEVSPSHGSGAYFRLYRVYLLIYDELE